MRNITIIFFIIGLILSTTADDFYGVNSIFDLARMIGFALPFALIGLLIGFIYTLARNKIKSIPTPETHVKCPDCRELVLKDALKCKHCGCKLIPTK